MTWTLFDQNNLPLGTGTGSYVSAGSYSFTIDASVTSAESTGLATALANARILYGANAPAVYVPGRLYVAFAQNGADGSFGDFVKFCYPTVTG